MYYFSIKAPTRPSLTLRLSCLSILAFLLLLLLSSHLWLLPNFNITLQWQAFNTPALWICDDGFSKGIYKAFFFFFLSILEFHLWRSRWKRNPCNAGSVCTLYKECLQILSLICACICSNVLTIFSAQLCWQGQGWKGNCMRETIKS